MVKIFKLTTQTSTSFPIEINVFERTTRQEAPFYQDNKEMQKQQFAICPGCNNPIQIIGLYKHLKNTDNPFGRHSPRPIPGFTYDPIAYDFCPYSTIIPPTDKSLRRELSPFSCDILKVTIQEFDRVVRILRADIGFNFSAKFAQKMLRTYLNEQGYLYPSATLRNIPWIVGYLSFSKNLVGQYLKTDSPRAASLKTAILENISESTITENGWLTRKSNISFNLQCFFMDHTIIKNQDGHLRESLKLIFISGRDEGPNGIIGSEIFVETVNFDHMEFERLTQIRTQNYRDQKLLDIAQEEYQIHLHNTPELKDFINTDD